MSRRLAIPEPLRKLQATASDPRRSAWVSANAGSGKTHVLTQRVLRLLLAGAPPGADPRPHLHQGRRRQHGGPHLQHARQMDEPRRQGSGGGDRRRSGAGKPGPDALKFARQLFARTIETPGGLKIQTLHAFCERLLQLFPSRPTSPRISGLSTSARRRR